MILIWGDDKAGEGGGDLRKGGMRSKFTDRHKVRKNTKPGEARLSSAQYRVLGRDTG